MLNANNHKHYYVTIVVNFIVFLKRENVRVNFFFRIIKQFKWVNKKKKTEYLVMVKITHLLLHLRYTITM